MKTKIIFILTMFSIVGCSKMPTADEMKNANYGIYPEDYKEILKEQLPVNFKDPYSAKLNYLDPRVRGFFYFRTLNIL